MGIGVSIFLLAVGAILAFAVEVTAEGVNLNTVGVILMIVGGIGLLFSLIFASSFWPSHREERVVTREREVL
jgi:hypothetical protein